MIPDCLQLTKLPFAIYFPAQDFGDKITISSRLRDSAPGLLDGDSLVLPVPAGGPPDVPRVQLQSQDKSYVLQLSTIRLSLEWTQRTPERRGWAAQSVEFFGALTGLLKLFVGEYARPTRFVFNPQFVLQTQGSANEYLATHLFQPGRVRRRPVSCKLGLMDQVRIDDQPVNVWFNVATARQRNRPDQDNALVVQFEFQTQREPANPFPAEVILNVLAAAEGLMKTRLSEVLGDLVDPAEPETGG